MRMKLNWNWKLKNSGKSKNQIGWWGWVVVGIFLLTFGTTLALHLLTLPARRVPTALAGSNTQSQLQPPLTPASVIGDATFSSNLNLPVSAATHAGLLVPVGQMGQSIVQGEFGLLVDQAVVLEPNAAESKSLLIALHTRLTNFQGSYYKVRSLAGSTFRLLPATPNSALPEFSQVTNEAEAKQPALALNQKQSLQFGDVASGWLTFRLTDLATATKPELQNVPLEFQFIPANTPVPIRVTISL